MLDIMAIPLTQGLYALVDGEDFERLNQWKWYALRMKSAFYAVRKTSGGRGKRKMISMHREILQVPKGLDTDHINHYGLDNRRQNLRSCTRGQNCQNQQVIRGGTSKYKGVYWNKKAGKWYAQIKHNNKEIYIGSFENETKAAQAYDARAKELFREFVYTNF